MALAVLYSGFVPGKLTHAVITGGISGAAQGVITGRSIPKSFIMGGVFEGVISFLPPGFNQMVIDGMDKNLENALIEYAQTSVKTGLRGGIVSLWEGEDFLKGFGEGAKYGILETTTRIIIYGFRYNPNDLFTQEDIDEYAEKEHNPILSERAYNGEFISMTKEEFKEIVFRKDGLIDGFGTSFEFGGHSGLSSNRQTEKDTLIHEGFHYGQEKHFGFLGLVLRYFKSLFEYGNSIYEDYLVI